MSNRHALAILGLWAFALLAYSNSFRAGLSLDNAWVIQEDSRIQAATSENARLILTQDYSYKNSSSGLYRPLTTFSYLVNYTILGGGAHPAGYHWVNFALHAVNILLVYWLGLLLFREMGPAWALAAVWALHPILTESVTNIVGRADLLAGFGVLAGLLCHVKSTAASGRRKLAWLAALLLAATIGIFSKESAVVLLAAMAIYDVTVGAPRRPARVRKPEVSARQARVPAPQPYIAVAVPLALFLYVRYRVFAGLGAAPVPFTDNPLVGAGFWTARLTAVEVIGKYLWLLVWPRDLSCDYSYNQIPVAGWGVGSFAVLAICAAAIFCYRRHKAVCFFIAFFFAALAPTSNLVILIGSIMAERFLYLPSVGFAGCLVWAIYRRPRMAPAALGLISGEAPPRCAPPVTRHTCTWRLRWSDPKGKGWTAPSARWTGRWPFSTACRMTETCLRLTPSPVSSTSCKAPARRKRWMYCCAARESIARSRRNFAAKINCAASRHPPRAGIPCTWRWAMHTFACPIRARPWKRSSMAARCGRRRNSSRTCRPRGARWETRGGPPSR